ncbi:CD2 antigen cytoplasmic tail-binding protein 2 homolog isoform X2 [Bacillus rossius redtenbacheri]|uniref:CD2 antigen cytoplasmic tail-binding protein 2 homolog isoform X2 n=1 Tax=Bacillus rossius redtenbacheri TaxID=93214 RepID=UPI002FDD4762
MAKRNLEEPSVEGAKRVKFEDDKKHSLDSDEEDDYAQRRNYDIMMDDDIEGQEESTLTHDGATKITPFNMREELEEGHFDVDGNYHWEQRGKLVADAWIENIDDCQIADRPIVSDSDSESDGGVPFDSVPVYRQLLALMRPGETVKKTLCRLGGKKPLLASERWRRKRAGQDCDAGDRSRVVEVTALADRLLTELGNMDIYQETYEHITALVSDTETKKGKSKAKSAASAPDDVLDMYADDFDEKERERLEKTDSHGTEDKLSTVGEPEGAALAVAD